jgi:hypothetical protein
MKVDGVSAASVPFTSIDSVTPIAVTLVSRPPGEIVTRGREEPADRASVPATSSVTPAPAVRPRARTEVPDPTVTA